MSNRKVRLQQKLVAIRAKKADALRKLHGLCMEEERLEAAIQMLVQRAKQPTREERQEKQRREKVRDKARRYRARKKAKEAKRAGF